MSQHDMNIANQGFPAFRSDLNNALAALVSNSSSATEPTTTFAYQFWADTTNDLLKQRNAANDGWINILVLSTGEPASADVATVVASQAEMEAGTESALRSMSPLRVAQAISALAVSQGKNAIINGNFDIWQRGTSQSSNGYGSADRWSFNGSGSTFSVSQQAFSLGQTSVPNEPEYYCRNVVTSSAGASNYALEFQKIEDVRTFAGQTVTLSFYAKADSNKNIAVEFSQNFGTGGSPSAEVTSIGSQLVALTTVWQKFEISVSIPSISGKTLGTNNNDYLLCTFWLDAGSTFNARAASLGQQSGTFDIAQVQLESGSASTDFERRSYSEELALCQRFFTVTNMQAGTWTGGNSSVSGNIALPVEMRVSPTVTTGSSTAGDYGVFRIGVGINPNVVPTINSLSTSGTALCLELQSVTWSSTPSNNSSWSGRWALGTFLCDSEL